jgi:predicted nucleic acid-binding protein
MPEVLLDSDMLIDHLRGYEPARQCLKRFETGEMQGYLSIITVAELAAGQMLNVRRRMHLLRFRLTSLPPPAVSPLSALRREGRA